MLSMKLVYSKHKVVLVEEGTWVKTLDGETQVFSGAGLEVGDTYFTTEKNWDRLTQKYKEISAMVLMHWPDRDLHRDYVIWNIKKKKWRLNERNDYTSDIQKAGLFERDIALEICGMLQTQVTPKGFPNDLPIILRDVWYWIGQK